MSPAILVVFYAALASPPDAIDPEQLLRRAPAIIVAQIEKQPNYACVQKAERDFWMPPQSGAWRHASCNAMLDRWSKSRPSGMRLYARDRLRFDVAVIGGEEMLSWPGEDMFQQDLTRELVAGGSLGTGDFGSFLISVFTSGAASVSYEGEETQNGRELARYSFLVNLENSAYLVRAGSDYVPTAYEGAFYIDRASAELVKMDVRSRDIPTETGLCQTRTIIDYEKVDLSGRRFLLPRSRS